MINRNVEVIKNGIGESALAEVSASAAFENITEAIRESRGDGGPTKVRR